MNHKFHYGSSIDVFQGPQKFIIHLPFPNSAAYLSFQHRVKKQYHPLYLLVMNTIHKNITCRLLVFSKQIISQMTATCDQ